MQFVFSPAAQPQLPVQGEVAVFPVRRVFCVGRNYAEHAREMGGDPNLEPPFFFYKPSDAVMPEGGDLPYPPLTQNLHHEVEMVVALQAGGANIPVDEALGKVFGYAVGLDMTRRDVQAKAKEKGHPWDMGKGFDASAPVSAIAPAAKVGHPQTGEVWLKVNGEYRQRGDLNQMSLNVAEVIANLSTYVSLQAGDLIFSGTPAGVGKVERGDQIECGVAGVGQLRVRYL